jgi:phospholipase C
MPAPSKLSKIDHFVVLMLENRSFDHMLGFLYTEQGNVSPRGHPYEGLSGNESNPDANGKPVSVFKIDPVSPYAYFMPGADPGEGYFNTNEQLFSNHIAPEPIVPATNRGFVENFAYTLKWEKKEKWTILPGTEPSHIMGMFPPKMLPVLSGLAKGYAVCDHWYGSVPTETLPNRAFLNTGTSQGKLADKDKTYTAPTIFGLLGKHNHSWKIYGYDSAPLSRASYTEITHAPNKHFGLFEDFQKDASAGKLANYTYLEPQWGKGGNSQHPNYDVAKGEALILDVFNALKSSPLWDKTMLIITYDEHGGCYDHVAPPENATPPDDTAGQYGFDFTRFGPRVPAVLVSPYIEAGTVFRVAEGSMPLDHTSILKTVEERFDLPPLTRRDAAAQGLGDVLTLHEARTDDPMHGIEPPVSKDSVAHDDAPDHLQHLYAETMASLPLEEMTKKGRTAEMPTFKNSDEAMEYGQRRYDDYFRLFDLD